MFKEVEVYWTNLYISNLTFSVSNWLITAIMFLNLNTCVFKTYSVSFTPYMGVVAGQFVSSLPWNLGVFMS
jgi:hypothetical protein